MFFSGNKNSENKNIENKNNQNTSSLTEEKHYELHTAWGDMGYYPHKRNEYQYEGASNSDMNAHSEADKAVREGQSAEEALEKSTIASVAKSQAAAAEQAQENGGTALPEQTGLERLQQARKKEHPPTARRVRVACWARAGRRGGRETDLHSVSGERFWKPNYKDIR